MPRTSPVFYVLPSAISITPNANESVNDLAVYVARGTKIKVYSQGIQRLSFDDNTYREWTLAGRNRRLADVSKPYTIYARLAKEDKSDGYLVFAPKVYEDDRWKDKYPYVTWTGLAKNTATATEDITNATKKYWFIKLGEVALPENGLRSLDYDTGILGTDQFNSEWNLDPDDMPLRIEIDCTVEGENAGPTPYVPWDNELILRARLVEGWADTDIERFDHWTIQRNTGDESADVSWPPEGRALGFGRTGNIVLAHSRNDSDDFNGSVSATFTVVAWGTEHEEESPSGVDSSSSLSSSSGTSDSSGSSVSSEDPVDSSSSVEDGHEEAAIVPIATATVTIMAETAEKYELEPSTSIVSYDPTTDAYSPTDGIKVRIRATDQKGSVFKLTRGQLDSANLVVQYAIADTDEWTTLTFENAVADIAEAAIPISVFTTQRNINVRICRVISDSPSSDSSDSDSSSDINLTLVEIFRTPIAFVRNGEDSKVREWIYLRSEKAIAFIGDTESSDSSGEPGNGQDGHLIPRLIPAGEVDPPGAALGIDTNKNQDGWVPEGWWDEMQGTDDTYHYEYGSYRDWIRQEGSSSGSSSGESADSGESGEQRIGHWGEFSKPTIWSYRAEDAVTYRCRWTLAGNVVYQLIAAYTGAFRGTLPLMATLMKRTGNGPEEIATADVTIITVRCDGLPYQITVNAQNPQFIISETVNPEFVSYLNNVELTGITITFTIDGDEHTFSIPVIRDADEDSIKATMAAYGEKLFLSKVHDDTAAGMIRFINKNGAQFGEDFASGLTGFGGRIDRDANAELESLTLRRFLEVPELRYNRISIQVGNRWRAPGGGIIYQVFPDQDGQNGYANTGTIVLHLEDGEIGKVAENDICMGIFHDGMTLSNNDADDFDDSRGNFRFSGFFTTYFRVTQIIETSNNSVFRYELRNDARFPAAHHPCDMMHFVAYGNFTNVDRQASRYSTLTYERYLYGVNNWEFTASNIGAQFGDLSNLSVYNLDMTGYSAYLNNIYMSGRFEQINTIVDQLSSYNVDFSDYVDVITVDDAGNVIGGLYSINDGVPYEYRIHSAISVRKNSDLLICCGEDEMVGKGKYKIYAEPVNCTCSIRNSTIYITSITNVKDGVAGTQDDAQFNYEAMRNMTNCLVNLTIDCEGVTSIIKQFPVTIKHQSEPFVGADISNEFSSVSWNTRTQAYIGLPVVFDFKMWHNNEMLNIVNTSNISLSSATAGVTLVNGSAPAQGAATSSIYYNKNIITVNGKKYARIQLTAMGVDIPPVVDIDVTCTANYSGVSYERTLRHTINKSTDTNVYQLLTDPAEVCAGYNANQQKVLNTNNITCSVRCDSTDDKHYTVSVADYAKHGLFITTQKFTMNANNQEVAGTEEAYSTVGGVTVSTDNTRVRFKLYKLADTTLSAIAALLDPSNVIEVLDAEDVPVVLDGLDGENSIQVVLDNDSDNVTCTEDGTVIAATLSVVHACLMDGEDAIGSGVLGSSRSADKQKYGTISSGTLTKGWEIECTNCTAEIADAWTTIDSKYWITINLKTIVDDTASINVKCLYSKHGQSAYYTRLFTVSKLYGIDKHEIILSPNSICYKANDDSYTPTNFSIYIYKTTQEEERHLMASLPSHSPLQQGDYRLQYSLDKGATWNNVANYNNGATIRETSDSGSGNKFSWDSADAIELRLQQYIVENNAGTWVLLDQESEDIIGDGQDGKGVEYIFWTQNSWDGEGTVGVDLPTPSIRDDSALAAYQDDNYTPPGRNGGSVWTDYWTDEPSGVAINMRYEFYAQRKKVNGVWEAFGDVHLWNRYATDGASGKSTYTLDLSNENSFINCADNGAVIGTYEPTSIILLHGTQDAYNDFNIAITANNISYTRSQDGKTITPFGITSTNASIVITATLKADSRVVLSIVYKINKIFAGETGLIYSLVPSLNVIHVTDSGSYIDTTMSVAVKKTVGTTTTMLETVSDIQAEGLHLFYIPGTSNGQPQEFTTSAAGVSTSSLCGQYLYTTILLCDASSNVLDRERINKVADGEPGEDGKGVEYIFWHQATWANEEGSGLSTPVIVDDSSADAFQNDNHVPYGYNTHNPSDRRLWTDEPSGVGANNRYEFYAQRKKVNGVWQAFGDVHLWNKYTLDGSSPYTFDLSNEHSFINVDDDGTVIGSYEPTTIIMLKGSEDAYSDFNYVISGNNISFTRSQDGKTITPSNIVANNATIVIEATLKSNLNFKLYATYQVNKLYAGETGIIYSIEPSLNVIHVSHDGTYIDTEMSVQVKKTIGQTTTLLTTPEAIANEGLRLSYIPGTSSDQAQVFTDLAAGISTATLCGQYLFTTILLHNSQGTLYDRERINKVADGSPGQIGPTGCHERVYEDYTPGRWYRNDENDSTVQGIRYIDFQAIEDETMASGYSIYMCKTTHQAVAQTFQLELANNPTYWQPIDMNVASAFFTYLIAKNAHFKFGSGNQFVIQDSNSNTVAGLTGAIADVGHEDDSVRIWAGSSNPYIAPFRVLQSGVFYSEKAHIRGLVEIRDATEGLIVYDNAGNARVQVVANEVDEPVNQTIHPTLQARQPQYHRGDSFNLTPTPISGSLGTLKAGAMLTVTGLSFTVSTNTGATHMKLTDTEKLSVSLVLMDTNGNIEATLEDTYEATSSILIEDISFAFRGVLIRTTKAYVIGISVRIEDIDLGNTAAGTWGGLAENAPVTTVPDLTATHATPVGTRIGTNGIFVNLGIDKAVSINADSMDIRYGSSRLRISSNGAYLWDGSEYVPIVKATKTISANYTVQKEDGVIFIDSASDITITLDATSSSRDFTIISKRASTDYYLTGAPVFRYDGTQYQDDPQRIDGQYPRRFVFDGTTSYYEFYGS